MEQNEEYWTIYASCFGERYGMIEKFYNHEDTVAWIKKNKDKYTPNSLKIAHHIVIIEVI